MATNLRFNSTRSSFLYNLQRTGCKAIIGIMILLGAMQTAAAASPYPPSQYITGIEWDSPDNIVRKAIGSDNWPMTWADDDNQYTSWGDGNGFGSGSSRVSLGFARIEGTPENFQGYNVWGGNNAENPATFDGKSYGIISIDGILYMWRGPGSQAAYQESVVYRSDDHAATWTPANWKFLHTEELSYPTFLQFGKDYQGARDGYVYIYAISHVNEGPRSKFFLLRTPKDQIMERNSYEFFKGTDANGNALWTSDINQKVPAFTDPNGGLSEGSVSYNAALGRYLLVASHNIPSAPYGGLGIFDAPEPWGPWTTVEYTDSWMGSDSLFFGCIPTKWISGDGKDFILVFTGFGSVAQDAYNHIAGTFVTGPVSADRLAPSRPTGLRAD